ncbi:hypothetical protein BC829DRAFT_93490 [Chytridium lagenaria]|nr:hypothetical protein BC829DRAFT_93490 [Chytridium lagenaria]
MMMPINDTVKASPISPSPSSYAYTTSPPPPSSLHVQIPNTPRTLDPQLAIAFTSYRFPDPSTTSYGFDLDDDDTSSDSSDDASKSAETRSISSEAPSVDSTLMRHSFLQSRVSRNFMDLKLNLPPEDDDTDGDTEIDEPSPLINTNRQSSSTISSAHTYRQPPSASSSNFNHFSTTPPTSHHRLSQLATPPSSSSPHYYPSPHPTDEHHHGFADENGVSPSTAQVLPYYIGKRPISFVDPQAVSLTMTLITHRTETTMQTTMKTLTKKK